MYNPHAKRPEAKKIMGELEIRRGTDAYKKTDGFYGFFAIADRLQSAVTGVAMTEEVAQIRNGERLQAEAEKESAANSSPTKQ